MTPSQRMHFFKTAGVFPTALGALGGALVGAGFQQRALASANKQISRQQRRMKIELAKQKLEAKYNPSPRNLKKVQELEMGYRVATFLKKHPAAATMASAGAGAGIGALAGRRIGKL